MVYYVQWSRVKMERELYYMELVGRWFYPLHGREPCLFIENRCGRNRTSPVKAIGIFGQVVINWKIFHMCLEPPAPSFYLLKIWNLAATKGIWAGMWLLSAYFALNLAFSRLEFCDFVNLYEEKLMLFCLFCVFNYMWTKYEELGWKGAKIEKSWKQRCALIVIPEK